MSTVTRQQLERMKFDQATLAAAVQSRRARQERDDLRVRYAQALGEISRLEQEIDFVRGVDLSSVKTCPLEPLRVTGKTETTAILTMVDVHAFQRVTARAVNGKNSYNPGVCRKRVRDLFGIGLRLVEIQRHGSPVRYCVLWLGGDLMENHLRDDQRESNYGSPTQEFMFLYGLCRDGIDFLLKHGGFDRVLIVCNDGNHGRDTEKPRITTRTQHSLEWLLYNMLSEHYRKEKRAEFVIADGYFVFQQIYKWRFRFSHGDAVHFQGGSGGVTIPLNKAIDRWNTAYTPHYDLIAHWHQFLWGGRFILPGSVCGYGPFSIRIKAAYEPPMQAIVFVEKSRGVTSVQPIFL